MKNKKGLVFIAIGLVFIAAAISLSVYNILEENAARESSRNTITAMEQLIPSEKDDRSEEIFENAAEAEIPDYVLNPDMDMPKINIDGTDYIGRLSIPSMNLELPVTDEWNYTLLRKSPCRYSGSVYKNDMVIAGHNYRSHFKGIESLPEGAVVIFTDTDGNEFSFAVAAIEVLPPTAVEEMTSGEWDLTLFTCNSTGNYRFAVRCDLI